MASLDPDFTGYQNVTLARGAHQAGTNKYCFQEVVAQQGYYQYGESWDAGKISIVLRQAGQRINDSTNDSTRQLLKTSVIQVMNSSNADNDLERRRAFKLMDGAVRTYVPAWLDFVGYTSQATTLRNLTPVTNEATARSARVALRNPTLSAKTQLSTKQAVVGPPTETGWRAYQAVIGSAGKAYLLASDLPAEYLVRYSDQYTSNVDPTTAWSQFGADSTGQNGFMDTLGLLAIGTFRQAILVT